MTVGQIDIVFKMCGKSVEAFEFNRATEYIQETYGLTYKDIFEIMCLIDLQLSDFVDGFYEDLIAAYLEEILDDIFDGSEIEYEYNYDINAHIESKLPFTFEGETDFIEAIKASGFAPLIKIIKASAPHLDFSDKA